MKIRSLFLMAAVAATSLLSSCKKDGDVIQKPADIINNIISEYTYNDNLVAAQKAQSGKDKAILLIAFGSTWQNSFDAFDRTKEAYEQAEAFKDYDVFVSFSSDICINRASQGENTTPRDFYEPRYLLHAIGAAKYSEIRVQSLQVIPGEEFANVVACVKKFMNNGYIASAHLDDAYLKSLQDNEAIFLGMPLLDNPDTDVPEVAKALHEVCKGELAQGGVAFMGHGNPDTYDTFKANIRYNQLQTALREWATADGLPATYYVGTVDAPGTYKYEVEEDMSKMVENGTQAKKAVSLHCLMSIAGDHAHNDMAGEGDEYKPKLEEDSKWTDPNPQLAEGQSWEDNEDVSWCEYFKYKGYTVSVPMVNEHPQGLLEISAVRDIWMRHTQKAQFLEDAYHSMYPEE